MLRLIRPVVIGWSAVLALSSALDANPRATPNGNAIERFISAPIYRHAQWGILIADASSGEPLFQLNSDKLFAPASTTKLFSGAAALVALGPNFRFVTPVYRHTARDSNGLQNDMLVLRAMGDPNLSGRIDRDGHLKYTAEDHIYANFSNRATLTDTDPLSGLDELAAQVASAQIHQVKDVLVDDRLFDPAEGSGSGPTRITPIVVNDDVFDILVTPTTEVGGQANVQIRPSTSYAQWDVDVKTVDTTDKTKIDISIGLWSSRTFLNSPKFAPMTTRESLGVIPVPLIRAHSELARYIRH
jgi:serine-type D-Ala-D-Ala carboxypeptidase/endopeptidase (penicillin-binding protein 4)